MSDEVFPCQVPHKFVQIIEFFQHDESKDTLTAIASLDSQGRSTQLKYYIVKMEIFAE